MARSAIACSVVRSNTVPVGLCGEFTTIIFVRGVIAARSSSGSTAKLGARRVTGTRVAPAIATAAG